MPSFETDLLEGFAQLLAANTSATWSSTGAYAAGSTGIALGDLPASPDRAVALMAYGVSDDPTLSDSTIGLQVLTRWEGADPRPVGALTGEVFDALQGLHDVQLTTGAHIVQCLRQSWTSLGLDANRRWRTSQNFYVAAHLPSPHRT